MKKSGLIVLMAIALLVAMTGIALAADITPYNYNVRTNDLLSNTERNRTFGTPPTNVGGANYADLVQGMLTGYTYNPTYNGIDYRTSTHPQGTWNSPYTVGVDGYNYNDPQDYWDDADQVTVAGAVRYYSGPHGGYLTSTHKCRECHAVHRAAGKFKLTRANYRYEACDWCHGTGAGSGFNIQMDNDDGYTREYNVGHSMGFGIQNGKWKAPDDTYPAFTPPYWQGGFSCFDCHSPHANPARIMGFNASGQAVRGYAKTTGSGLPPVFKTRYYNIVNPGHGATTNAPGRPGFCSGGNTACHLDGQTPSSAVDGVPLYMAGSWLLLKNPDKEIATNTETVTYYRVGDYILNGVGQPTGVLPGGLATANFVPGQEIFDTLFAFSHVSGEATVTSGAMRQFSTDTPYPVNKVPVDWNAPIGAPNHDYSATGEYVRNPSKPYWIMGEFCVDCHDGNTGLHTVQAPMFSEDRALRNQGSESNNWKGNYDVAYSHDSQIRHCRRQMIFNPEDNLSVGPSCRNCHRGSSSCGRCHTAQNPAKIWTNDIATASLHWSIVPTYSWVVPGVRQALWASTFNNMFTSTNFVPGAQEYEIYNNLDPNYNVAYFDPEIYDNAAHSASGPNGRPYIDQYKTNRTVEWNAFWRVSPGAVPMGQRMDPMSDPMSPTGIDCSDDGFSWPHRTLGWKMLKDDLFGLDIDGDIVAPGDTRYIETSPDNPGLEAWPVHDLDSVCLDCHNPTVWRATSTTDHTDTLSDPNDDYDDELLLRGLP